MFKAYFFVYFLLLPLLLYGQYSSGIFIPFSLYYIVLWWNEVEMRRIAAGEREWFYYFIVAMLRFESIEYFSLYFCCCWKKYVFENVQITQRKEMKRNKKYRHTHTHIGLFYSRHTQMLFSFLFCFFFFFSSAYIKSVTRIEQQFSFLFLSCVCVCVHRPKCNTVGANVALLICSTNWGKYDFCWNGKPLALLLKCEWK